MENFNALRTSLKTLFLPPESLTPSPSFTTLLLQGNKMLALSSETQVGRKQLSRQSIMLPEPCDCKLVIFLTGHGL